MKALLAAGAALGLALTAAPATAQTTNMGMTTAQKTMYDGWPSDRRAMYDAWPANAQTYYWTLNEQQRTGWWVLNDEQRLRVVAMTPEQRAAAWTSIMNQMNPGNSAGSNASTTGMTARTAAGMASTSQPRFVSKAVVQTTPAGYAATADTSNLPVCKPNQQDGCINSWEKNKTGTRPLNYWPGKPASQM